MSEQVISIPGRLKNAAVNGHVAGVEDIIDDSTNKTQQTINSETGERVSTLEENVGTGGSVDARIAVETARATGVEELLQSEISGLNSQNYVSVDSYSELPSLGDVDTIYRVGSWDGTQVDATKYAEYAWNNTGIDQGEYVLISVKTQIGEVFDISDYHSGATYADLAAALDGGNNVPAGIRRGGMSVKYIQSSDNKYVQYRLIATSFSTTVSDWQGVDDNPTFESDNLVKSGGVFDSDKDTNEYIQGLAVSLANGEYQPMTPDSTLNGKVLIPSNGTVADTSTESFIVKVFNLSSLSANARLNIKAIAQWGNLFYSFFSAADFTDAANVVEHSEASEYNGDLQTKDFLYIERPLGATYLCVSERTIPCEVKLSVQPNDITITKDIIFGDVSPLELTPDIESGKYVYINGNLAEYGSYSIYKYDLSGLEGKKLKIIGSTNWTNLFYAFYSNTPFSSSTVLQISEAGTGSETKKEFNNVSIPSGAKYLVVNNYNGMGADAGKMVKSIINPVVNVPTTHSRLYGKKWACVGDSLTEVNSTATKKYYNYIAEETEIEPIVYGVSGSGYARKRDTDQAFYQRVQSIDTQADVITIFGSFNDLGAISSESLPWGDIDDNTNESMAGCINLTIDNILSRFVTPRLGIISPTSWGERPNSQYSVNYDRYVELLHDICQHRSIPFLNLYECSNLHPWNETCRAATYSNDPSQTVHPDNVGHSLIAPMIRQFVLSLI